VTPVMLYFGLTYEQEAELFDTINSTQRKLPKALIEVTKGDITEAGSQTHGPGHSQHRVRARARQGLGLVRAGQHDRRA